MARRGGTEADRRARGEETRQALIAAGRALFAERGYFDTSTTDIVERAGVGTRGAFYHHFADKTDLFRAVFEAVEHDLVQRGLSVPTPSEPLDRLRHAFAGFLEGALQPEVQRIMLVDGTAVLGWETRRAIEEANSLAAIEAVLRQAMADGAIEEQPPRELAHVLVGALEEAALYAARAEDREAATREVRAALVALVDGMVATPGVPSVLSG